MTINADNMQTVNKTPLAYYVQQEQIAELMQMKEHTKMSNFFLQELKSVAWSTVSVCKITTYFFMYQTAGHEV